MPAPKAVLRDINDFGLDPSLKFGRISSSGRLAHDGAGTTGRALGAPPVTTGPHFHFYGRTATHHEEVEVTPLPVPVEEVHAVEEKQPVEEPVVEKTPVDVADDEAVTVPEGKKGRFRRGAPPVTPVV